MAIFITLPSNFVLSFSSCHCLSCFHHFIFGLFWGLWGPSQETFPTNHYLNRDHMHIYFRPIRIFWASQNCLSWQWAITFQVIFVNKQLNTFWIKLDICTYFFILFSIFRQHCALNVPSLMISEDQMTSEMKIEAAASYRLVYELLLPYILPIVLLGE